MVSRNWDRLWSAFRSWRLLTGADVLLDRVGGTLVLISWISFSSQIFIVWPWYGRTLSIDLLKMLVPFKSAICLTFWSA